MTKFTTAALLAASIFALYSAPSFAQFSTAPPCYANCGGGGGGDGGGGGGSPTEPGDPFDPGNPGGDPDQPGDDPNGDPGDDPKDDPNDDPNGDPKDDPEDDPKDDPNGDAAKQASGELRRCLARLGQLPEVSAADIGALGQPRQVSLSPICEQTSLTDVQPVLIEGGNVFGLEPLLKANELIRSKLGQTAYKSRDVVGIDFDARGNAVLLVHRHRG